MTLTKLFTQIADAIREKKGTTEPIVAEDFPTEIGSISGGENPLDYFASLTSGTSSTNISNAAALKIIKKIPDNISIDGTSLAYAFKYCRNLIEVGMIDTSDVTNMQNMFASCTSLTTVPLLNTSSVTNMQQMFYYCSSLEEIPQLNTSSVTNMQQMFYYCSSLEEIPELNTSNVENMINFVNGCSSLSDTSLNNILKMCINATNYANTKTLLDIGITSAQATVCQGLSNYADFVTAGWSTGY